MEIQYGDICATLTYVIKCFHMKIEVCNLCKYKRQGPLETFVVFHRHFCKGLLNQNI
jgi:hypothetical protein